MPPDLRFARNVILKAGALFIIANLLFALLYPLPALGRVSIYNRLVPGRLSVCPTAITRLRPITSASTTWKPCSPRTRFPPAPNQPTNSG